MGNKPGGSGHESGNGNKKPGYGSGHGSSDENDDASNEASGNHGSGINVPGMASLNLAKKVMKANLRVMKNPVMDVAINAPDRIAARATLDRGAPLLNLVEIAPVTALRRLHQSLTPQLAPVVLEKNLYS